MDGSNAETPMERVSQYHAIGINTWIIHREFGFDLVAFTEEIGTKIFTQSKIIFFIHQIDWSLFADMSGCFSEKFFGVPSESATGSQND